MLKGKNIVVTGANRGIRLEIAKLCAQNGANVFVCIRKYDDIIKETFENISQEYCTSIFPINLDISDETSIRQCAAEILKYKLPIDGIVNNAGISGTQKTFLMTSMQDIKNIFEVNFFGPMQLTQRLLKNMIRNKHGAIINISSAAALDGDPAQFEYVTSKAALIGATKKLAIELGNYGISVNAIAPGVTETDMITQMKKEVLIQTINKTALKRIGKPEEIAGIVVYLLSGRCNYLTGQVIRVDGCLY